MTRVCGSRCRWPQRAPRDLEEGVALVGGHAGEAHECLLNERAHGRDGGVGRRGARDGDEQQLQRGVEFIDGRGAALLQVVEARDDAVLDRRGRRVDAIPRGLRRQRLHVFTGGGGGQGLSGAV